MNHFFISTVEGKQIGDIEVLPATMSQAEAERALVKSRERDPRLNLYNLQSQIVEVTAGAP